MTDDDLTPPPLPPPTGSVGEPVPEIDLSAILEPPPSVFAPADEPPPDMPPIVDRTPDSSRPLLGLVGGVAGAGILAAIWWFVTRAPDPIVAADDWPSPGATWDAFRDEVDEEFVDHLGASVGRFVVALLLGGAIGSALGAVMGHVLPVRAVLRPIVGLFRWVSPVMILPLIILWTDFGELLWVPAALGTGSLVAWQTYAAISDEQAGRASNRLERSIISWRAAAPLTWAAVFAAELFGTRHGMARAALQGTSTFSVDIVVVYVLAALALAVTADLALRIAQHGARR